MNACAARDTLLTDENSVPTANGRKLRPEGVVEFAGNPLFAAMIDLDCEPLTPAILANTVITVGQIDSLGPLLKEGNQ